MMASNIIVDPRVHSNFEWNWLSGSFLGSVRSTNNIFDFHYYFRFDVRSRSGELEIEKISSDPVFKILTWDDVCRTSNLSQRFRFYLRGGF